ncbi:MAG: phosphate ABC transporter ATP-binding protein [Kiritimatiellae bacterium]|nr:phosphate ABC transporter ATP-binding protein [Kiritimatiellia bacterium]
MNKPDADDAVTIRALSVAFDRKTVLHRVDMDVPREGITLLIGPSGSGKTTLLRTLNRLNECFENCTTEGRVTIRFDAAPLDVYDRAVSLPALRRRVAMVFQTPNVLPVSIERNLLIPLKAHYREPLAALRQRVVNALDQVDLLGEVRTRLHEKADTLSGGQQQRLCLARALALEPSILLLDEPTANLDFRAVRRIEALLQRLKARYTILAVSHSLGQTRRLADRVFVLRDGRISGHFDKADLRHHADFEAAVEDVF